MGAAKKHARELRNMSDVNLMDVIGKKKTEEQGSHHHPAHHGEQEAGAVHASASRPGDGAKDEGAVNDPHDALAAIAKERDQLANEKMDLEDRYLRLQAEFQNARRRAEKDRAEFAEYASTEAVRALLPIVDDFERALKVDATDVEHAKEYAKGMELIYQRLFESLKKLGLEPVESAGLAFNPHVHHAVEMVETEETADNTVIDEYQRGYNFKGRLLRPAMVRVAVEPTSRKA
jgi:molecular chaperone GrpE